MLGFAVVETRWNESSLGLVFLVSNVQPFLFFNRTGTELDMALQWVFHVLSCI